MIISHEHELYRKRWHQIGRHRWNGAYFYSREICELIIPNVKTNRSWITIKAGEEGCDHSILFVHDNVNFEQTYEYMKRYEDVIYVVGLPDMVERAEAFGKTIYLPLSVDVEYIQKYRIPERKKTREIACFGRPMKRWQKEFPMPEDVEVMGLMPRDKYLNELAKTKKVFAIGRTAIEAKVLGAEVLPFHPRLPDVSLWKVLDSRDAAKILQKKLDEIDGVKK